MKKMNSPQVTFICGCTLSNNNNKSVLSRFVKQPRKYLHFVYRYFNLYNNLYWLSDRLSNDFENTDRKSQEKGRGSFFKLAVFSFESKLSEALAKWIEKELATFRK